MSNYEQFLKEDSRLVAFILMYVVSVLQNTKLQPLLDYDETAVFEANLDIIWWEPLLFIFLLQFAGIDDVIQTHF